MAILLFFVLFTTSSSDTHTDQELLTNIKRTYAANAASFQYGESDFDIITGQASEGAATKPHDVSNALIGKGKYIFDDRNARCENLYDDATLLRGSHAINDMNTSSALYSFRALCDGKVTLMERIIADAFHHSVQRVSEIKPGMSVFCSAFEFPLNLGKPNCDKDDLPSNIDLIRTGGYKLKSLERSIEFEGRKVVRIELSWSAYDRIYWVDTDRGSVPLRTLTKLDSGHYIDSRYDDIIELQGFGWLPKTMSTFISQASSIRIIHLHTIDISHMPDRANFRIEFEKATALVDTSKDLIYSPRKSWSLDELPRIGSKESKPLQKGQSAPIVPHPGEIEVDRTHGKYFTIAVMVLFGGSVCLWYRRRRG